MAQLTGESSEARQRSRSPRRADSEDWLVLNLMEAALDILAGPGPGRLDGSQPPRPSQVALTAAVAEEVEPRVEVEDDCAATATKEASQETTDTQGTATTLPDDVSKAWRELGTLVKDEGKVLIDAAKDMSDYMQSVCDPQKLSSGPAAVAMYQVLLGHLSTISRSAGKGIEAIVAFERAANGLLSVFRHNRGDTDNTDTDNADAQASPARASASGSLG